MAHTQTPWHVRNTAGDGIQGQLKIFIGNTDIERIAMARDDASAAHIVKCVNAFPELVNALQVALEFIDDQSHSDCDFNQSEDFCSRHCEAHGCIKWKVDTIRAALAKAGAQP